MPKIIPLSKSHRRGRHSNLFSLLSMNHTIPPPTTTRIVSDEDMQICSTPVSSPSRLSQSFSRRCEEDDDDDRGVVSDDTAQSTVATDSESIMDFDHETFHRMSRHSPSMCLSSLAEFVDKSSPMTPFLQRYRSRSIDSNSSDFFTSPNSTTIASSPWGQFVDMLVPEEDEVTHDVHFHILNSSQPFCVSPSVLGEQQQQHLSVGGGAALMIASKEESRFGAPYPRNRVRPRNGRQSPPTRIQLKFKKQFGNDNEAKERDCLDDFVLKCPEMDEASLRLGSLSF
jgi:hypothetical protein